MFSKISKLWLVLAVLAALSLTSGAALAHENRESGKYQFVVGFMTEPAFEGFKNGVSFRITKPLESKDRATHDEEAAHEHDAGGHDATAVGLDVAAHGALFSSPGLEHDQTFSFEVGHNLENLTIPYHSHIDHDLKGIKLPWGCPTQAGKSR